MLYFILRPLTRIALKAYFRRITINGLENLPKDKPLLLCSNHPTGFIEPCLMACFLPRVLHFLVRGDLFEKPILSKVLVSTNQIPIYRFRDGYKKLRNNRDVMNISYDKLAAGEAIVIFPEASTLEVKHLRPLKKGAARMALETLKLHPGVDLEIIPIGINYSSSNRWRSYVNINIGKPITPELPQEETEFPRAIVKLTQKIGVELSKQLLVLNEGVRNEDLNLLLDISQWEQRPKTSIRARYNESERFKYERSLSESLKSQLSHEKISEAGPDYHKFSTRRVDVGEWILASILAVPIVFLLILNALPVLIGVWIRNKYVTENEFIGAVAIAASLWTYIFLFPLIFVILVVFYGWWAFLMFLLPILGLIGLYGLDYLQDVWYRSGLQSRLGKAKQEQIFKAGKDILDSVYKKDAL